MVRLLVYFLNLVFVILVGWIVSRIMQQILGPPRNSGRSPRSVPRNEAGPALRGETARDPVCGMFVSTEVSHQLRQGGETLHFCSQECLDRYQSEARHS
jgi:YHS domain-containing protein